MLNKLKMNEERENPTHYIDEIPIRNCNMKERKKVRKGNEDLSYISRLKKITQKESIKEISNG